MNIVQLLLKEFAKEAVTTRKMLERIPDDKYSWKPHEKSMTIQQLSTHIAELPGWVSMVINTSELDFAANPYEPKKVANTKELLEILESSLCEERKELEQVSPEKLDEYWTLRNGEQVLDKSPKHEVIRMCLSQVIHHRAQLGVYLRLLNVPVPGSYGPSADDHNF